MEALRALRPALNGSLAAAASWFHSATQTSSRRWVSPAPAPALQGCRLPHGQLRGCLMPAMTCAVSPVSRPERDLTGLSATGTRLAKPSRPPLTCPCPPHVCLPLPRLHYAFHPESGRWEDRSCPIRDMGTAADLAVLQRHLADRRQFDEVGWGGGRCRPLHCCVDSMPSSCLLSDPGGHLAAGLLAAAGHCLHAAALHRPAGPPG